MIADGLTNVEIGERLGVTVHAVKFHLNGVYRKLGVANRTAAAVARMNGENGDHADPLEFWRDELAGATVLDLPTDHPRPAVLTRGVARARTAVPAETTRAIAELLEADTRLDAILASAVCAVMSRYTGQA